MTQNFFPPVLAQVCRIFTMLGQMAAAHKFMKWPGRESFAAAGLLVRAWRCLILGMLFIAIVLGVFAPIRAQAASLDDLDNLEPGLLRNLLGNETELDLFCLRKAYPQIEKVEIAGGEPWLFLRNGRKIPYNDSNGGGNIYNASLRESMEQIYALEPERPDLKPGMAPGRKRSQSFMEALYGSSSCEVLKNLVPVKYWNKYTRLSPEAAQAFAEIVPRLEKWRMEEKNLRPWLAPEGGFYWRKIAGENRLSPHAFGIALDIGVKAAPYWRWAKVNPHPKQKTYPAEIVQLFEKHGFIWGGKWHEYDLMHFEYRPELICKAKILGKKQVLSSSIYF